MLTQLFSKRHSRYTTSPAADWLEAFSDWLMRIGYEGKPAQLHVFRLKHVLEQRESVPITGTFSVTMLQSMFAHRRAPAGYRATRRVFHRFLVERGALTVDTTPDRFADLLFNYRRHLTDLRGLAIATTQQHLTTVAEFLAQSVPPRSCLEQLSAEAVERFVSATGRRVTRQTLQHTVARLRAFLRYGYDRGIIVRRLDAIDTPRTYRDELPPRAIDWRLAQRLLASIDLGSRSGWRDLAMLHLMAHYGLRPSEVAALTLDAIDWKAGTLRVEQHKTRSDLLLPVNPRTLSLLRHYLRRGRPGTVHSALFLRARTPAGPISHYAVGDTFKKRARASGLPLEGFSAYGLRHGFAMRLLNRGVGIKAIGDLLGHRTLESTCVYLRLHTDALREVALPIPRLPRRSAGRFS
jgi:integrase/recombinase XerD